MISDFTLKATFGKIMKVFFCPKFTWIQFTPTLKKLWHIKKNLKKSGLFLLWGSFVTNNKQNQEMRVILICSVICNCIPIPSALASPIPVKETSIGKVLFKIKLDVHQGRIK